MTPGQRVPLHHTCCAPYSPGIGLNALQNRGISVSLSEAPPENRLHAGIGYVTPEDEHTGRGEAVRAARRQGLQDARARRLADHRQHRNSQ